MNHPLPLLLLLLLAASMSFACLWPIGLVSGEPYGDESSPLSSALAPYREPGWFLRTLQELLYDIDWKTIAAAKEQVELVLRAMDRMVRNVFSRADKGDKNAKDAGPEAYLNRIFSSGANSWWSKATKGNKGADQVDPSQVKAMLERVACFVGYMKLMTHSTEALAELDASKVVTNLLSAASTKTNSGGLFGSWFG